MDTTQAQEYVELPGHLGSNVYVIGITKGAQWMVPDAEQVAADPDMKCARGDTAILWHKGNPVLCRLYMAAPPRNLWEGSDEFSAIFVLENEDGSKFRVDANRVDSIAKIIGRIDANGEYFEIN